MPANALRPLGSFGSLALRARAWAILVGLLAATAFVASASPASAHARLVSISPADGATVATPPSQVVITFSEDLLATVVRIEVKDAGGKAVADGSPVVKGAVATQPLAGGLGAGPYTVTFRVVSKDGHPVSGSTTFTATDGSTLPSGPAAETSTPTGSTTVPTSSPTTNGTRGGDGAESGPNLLVRGVETLLVLAVAIGIVLLGRRLLARRP